MKKPRKLCNISFDINVESLVEMNNIFSNNEGIARVIVMGMGTGIIPTVLALEGLVRGVSVHVIEDKVKPFYEVDRIFERLAVNYYNLDLSDSHTVFSIADTMCGKTCWVLLNGKDDCAVIVEYMRIGSVISVMGSPAQTEKIMGAYENRLTPFDKQNWSNGISTWIITQ